MTFQLTPLLDLLLIVIFAQFMDVRETSARSEKEFAEKEAALMARVEQERTEVESRRQNLNRNFQDIVRQQQDTGEVLSRLFDISPAVVRAALQLRSPSRDDRDRHADEVTERLKQMSEQKKRSIVKEVLTYNELRKRCDVWELYVTENGTFRFGPEGRARDFRAESSAEFSQNLFEEYKTLPEPRTLVVILFSYGDTQARYYQLAIDGIPDAVDRMRQDRGLRSWFEFAILGFSPRGPVLRTDTQ